MLKRWAVPIETEGRRIEVRGDTSWVPFDQTAMQPGAKPADDGGGGPVWLVLIGLAGLAGLGAAVALRRRSGRAAASH